MNSKGHSPCFIALLVLTLAVTAIAHPQPGRQRYALAERMCAGARQQSDALTVTRWEEWLGDGNARWQLPPLQRHTHLQSAGDIRARLVRGTCDDAPFYELAPATSDLRYPQADGSLGRTPRLTSGGDGFGYGGLGSGSNGWGDSGSGEGTIGMGGIGSLGGGTPAPSTPCNTAIVMFEARFRASDWCGVTREQRVPNRSIEGTARVISTRPAYRPPPRQRR